MRWVTILFLILFLAAVGYLAREAWPHDHWIRHGGYVSKIEKIDKAIDPYPNGCCGPGDCFIQPVENIRRTEDGYYFAVIHPEALKFRRGEYFISHEDADLSKDGQYWACFNTYDWKLKCFFYPLNT